MEVLYAAVGAFAGTVSLFGLGAFAWLRHRRLQTERRLGTAFDRARLRRERETGKRMHEVVIWPAVADQ